MTSNAKLVHDNPAYNFVLKLSYCINVGQIKYGVASEFRFIKWMVVKNKSFVRPQIINLLFIL
jgi:hypothetical protein